MLHAIGEVLHHDLNSIVQTIGPCFDDIHNDISLNVLRKIRFNQYAVVTSVDSPVNP